MAKCAYGSIMAVWTYGISSVPASKAQSSGPDRRKLEAGTAVTFNRAVRWWLLIHCDDVAEHPFQTGMTARAWWGAESSGCSDSWAGRGWWVVGKPHSGRKIPPWSAALRHGRGKGHRGYLGAQSAASMRSDHSRVSSQAVAFARGLLKLGGRKTKDAFFFVLLQRQSKCRNAIMKPFETSELLAGLS